MRLYIIQHGEAVSKEDDPDRPLSNQGKQDIQKIARWMQCQKIGAAAVLHSGKTRAWQSAEVIGHQLHTSVEKLNFVNPNDPTAPFIQHLSEGNEDLILVSHMPFVGNLASRLLTGKEENHLSFTPGTLACLELDEENEWHLRCFLSPAMLCECDKNN